MLALLANFILPYKPSFPYADTLLASSGLPAFIYSWGNFDGVHYVTIAKQGYATVQYIQAFFPLLPYALMRPLFLLLQINPLVSGLILTNIFAFTAIASFYHFTKTFFDAKTAWLTVLVLLAFPTSLFLGALYTEGLFLTLVFGCLLFAHQKKWLAATLLAALASSTRIVGIFLIPALLIELWPEKSVKKIAVILLGSLGLIGYMVYLKFAVGDPLAFFHAQSSFGAGRQTNLVLYPQVVWRSLKILLTNKLDLKYFAYVQEFLAGTLGLVGIAFSAKYSRLSWLVFTLFAFFLPPLTGTFSSMGRYLLVCFPLFILLAKILETRPRLRVLWFVLSTALLIVNTVLFIQGYWVA